MHGWWMSNVDVSRRRNASGDSWCHWHGCAQKPLSWAPSGCDVVASLLRFALRSDERRVAISAVMAPIA